jgi:hypothetical protein
MSTAKPLALPISFGLADGSNANFLVDATGSAFGELYVILRGVSVDEARRMPLYAKGIKIAEYLTHATNKHAGLVLALKHIASTAQHKRIANYALAALQAAGEIK